MKKRIDLSLWLQQGVQFYKAGEFAEAEALYRKTIEVKADYAHAWFLLAMLKWKQQRWQKTEEYLGKAVDLQPENPHYLMKWGEFLYQHGQQTRGLAQLDKALELHDQQDVVYVTKGKLLRNAQQFIAAEQAFLQALEINPANYNAANHLGNVLSSLNRLEEAENYYLQVVKAKPELPQPYLNLGTIYAMRQQKQEALTHFELALQRNPNWVQPYEKVTQLFMAHHEWVQALQVVKKGLELHPNHLTLLELASSIYGNVKSYTQVAKYVKKILAIDPNHAEANFQYGVVLSENGRKEDALSHFKKALELNPESDQYHIYLGRAYQDLDDFQLALTHFQQAKALKPNNFAAIYEYLLLTARLCNWDTRQEDEKMLVEAINQQVILEEKTGGFIPILTLNYFPIPPVLHLKAAKHTAKHLNTQVASIKRSLNFQFQKQQKDKIRIGYYSPDFRKHAVGTLIQDMFQYHDRDRFEIYAYALILVKDDEIQEKIKAHCDVFTPVSNWSFQKTAKQIHEDQIDILIDLGGYTSYTRTEVMALQPAPIQAQYIGLLDTMGADFIDYAFSDQYCIPPELEPFYSEKILHLPQAFVSSPMKISEKQTQRADWHLPEDAFVFCCFNASYKFDPTSFDAWMEILRQVPNSVFWTAQPNSSVQENLLKEVTKRGISTDRIIYCDKVPLDAHLERTRHADLFLDTFNFNGGAVTVGTLQAGLPILTLSKNTYASRIGGSILSKIGLDELITHSVADYITKAVNLSQNPSRLQQLKQQLDHGLKASKLFDTAHFVETLEARYEQMWETYLTQD
ncbi:MAG: tetratricopeptide repeat protein [Flammeovirgaceae bacterium]